MQSESVTKVVGALLKAQKELPKIEKTKVNPFYKSKYADLSEILEKIGPVLQKHELAISQTTGFEGGIFGLITTLYHSSGEFLHGFYQLDPGAPHDPQKLAATLTYGRRMAITAILSIVAEDEVDGNDTLPHQTAGHAPTPQHPTVEAVKGSFKTISKPQSNRLYAIAKSNGYDDKVLGTFLYQKWGFKRTDEVTPALYEEICTFFSQPAMQEEPFA